jgi:hypothetical protein
MTMIAVGGGRRWNQQDGGERRGKSEITQHRILFR